MNDDSRGGRERLDDTVEAQPQWPQRPARPQPPAARPRLDPPDSGRRTTDDGRRTTQQRPSSASSTPVVRRPSSVVPTQDDPKETRMLPLVEPSRFQRDARSRPAPKPPTPADSPRQTGRAQHAAPL